MATTNYTLGGAATNNTVLTMSFAANKDNVLAENDTTATSGAVTTKNAEAYIAVSNFGFDSSVPSNATITQVNLKARGTASSGASAHTATPYISTTAGSALSANNTSLTTVESLAITRPGGGTWTRTDLLNGTFTVRLRSLHPNNTNSRTYQWAWVEVEVVYTTPTDYPLTAAQGSFSLTGQSATLSFGRNLTADQGSIALTGQDVTLTYTPYQAPPTGNRLPLVQTRSVVSRGQIISQRNSASNRNSV